MVVKRIDGDTLESSPSQRGSLFLSILEYHICRLVYRLGWIKPKRSSAIGLIFIEDLTASFSSNGKTALRVKRDT